MPTRTKTNGNFSDTSVERVCSVMASTSDAVDLACPCNNLFEFQVVHRYVFKVVEFCLK